MSDREGLERFVGKVMLDRSFRERVLGDPEGAAESIGVPLTSGQLERIREWTPELLEVLAGPFEDWLARLLDWLMQHFGRGW